MRALPADYWIAALAATYSLALVLAGFLIGYGAGLNDGGRRNGPD